MRNPGKTISAAILVAMLIACGDAPGPVDANPTRNETAPPPPPPGGGTYGSGGNLIPGGTLGVPARMDAAAGGGTYGSGGKVAPDSTGSNTVTGVTTTATTDCGVGEERGGGTYGSGGRTMECATEPTP